MSTRCWGRARRKFSSGMSDWPPASTFASSIEPSRSQASSTLSGAWYANGAGFTYSLLQHGDGAAQRRLATLEAPRKAAEQDLPVEHLVELSAEILDVDDVVRKQQRVHDLVVGLGKDLIQAATELLLRLLRLVGADPADDGVHRVVRAAHVNRDPAHPALQDPFGEGARRPGMADEVLRLVQLRPVGPVLLVLAVVAGADDQDVAALDLVAGVLLPPLEVLRTVDVVVADAVPLQVDDARGADQEVERQVADELAAGHEVRGRVEVRADVQRHRDLLPAGLLEREPLDPANRRPRIARERRRVEGEVLGEVEEPHFTSCDRWTLPIALRGNVSTVTTRLGHLYAASRSCAKAMRSFSSSGCEPEATTNAVTSSPHFSLGTPATATSCTAGCSSSTSSTSRG